MGQAYIELVENREEILSRRRRTPPPPIRPFGNRPREFVRLFDDVGR